MNTNPEIVRCTNVITFSIVAYFLHYSSPRFFKETLLHVYVKGWRPIHTNYEETMREYYILHMWAKNRTYSSPFFPANIIVSKLIYRKCRSIFSVYKGFAATINFYRKLSCSFSNVIIISNIQ